jgi:glycosyltransferase involved in cell wall biosynthesis
MIDYFSKVLFIGPLNTYGGIGAVLRTYKKNVPHFNFIATHRNFNKIGSSLYFIYSLLTITYTFICKNSIQIVHLHSASKGSFVRKILIVMISKFFNKKVIFHMHGGQFMDFYGRLSWSKYIFNSILQQVDLFICLTEEWKDYFTQNFDIKNIVVIGNPVMIQSIINYRPTSNVISLLFLGNLNPKKGIFEFLNYLVTNPHFQSKKINITIGGNGEVERLKKITEDPKYMGQIKYLGFVEGLPKSKALDACDIFILPSFYEGLPISILEALGHGKPVIATRVGGVPSVVKNHVNGWLFNAGNFEELNTVFDTIVNQQFPLKLYQLNSYEIANKFSIQNILLQLSNEYKKLLK